MNPEAITEAEAACIRLQQRYGTLADRQDPKFRDLFTADAVINLPPLPGIRPLIGLEDIMQGLEGWKASTNVVRHVCTNFEVEVADPDQATGICYLMVYRAEPAPGEQGPFVPTSAAFGEYHDVFVRQDGRWLFKSRTMNLIFHGVI